MAASHAPLFLEGTKKENLVVFIHGFMGSPRQFDKLARIAHKQGCSAAALLLPGHGGAAKEFASGTYERWQNHVCAEVEMYSRDHTDIWLAGHSMGGLLAINAAVKHSLHVRGLFLIACPFRITTVSVHAIKVRIMQVCCRKNNPVKSAYMNGSSVTLSPGLIWRTIRPTSELKTLMQAARDNLPNVRVPVTAVYSKSDELTSIGSLETLKAELTGAPLKELLLTDSLHAYYPEHEQSIIEESLAEMLSAKK